MKDELTIDGELIMKDNRILIPKRLQKRVLEVLHETHLGTTKSKQLAQQCIFWPGINDQITKRVERSEVCQYLRATPHTEPMLPYNIKCLQYNKIGVDLFECNHNMYIIRVDYYTKYPEISKLPNTSSHTIIETLKNNFGIPEFVVSEIGPQFISHEYKSFATHYRFHPMYTSP